MGYKDLADGDDRIREYSLINNDTEPTWGKVNYGNLDELKVNVKDLNGTEGDQIGESRPVIDMVENALAESKVAPTPDGLTVHITPGVQPTGKLLNTLSIMPEAGKQLKAPRYYYLSSHKVEAQTYNNGSISRSPSAQTELTVMQVPYGEDSSIAATTGLSTKPSKEQEIAKAISKDLTKLKKLSRDQAGSGELSKVLFTQEFDNLNNLINTGRYADRYKAGLSIALGDKDGSQQMLPGVLIKSDISSNTVYGQFDFIYNSMKSGKGDGYYSPALVSWAQENAESIIHLLMVNYMLQSQFKGDSGDYVVPINKSNWSESSLPYYKDLKAKGRKSKEPFYLYTTMNGKELAKLEYTETTPRIPSQHIQPDLSYIYSLYTAIMAQVWVGADGLQNKYTTSSNSQSQTWEDAVGTMNKAISSNKVKAKGIPNNANKVSDWYADFRYNNLVGGLSTQSAGKAGTASVYTVDLEIIGALRSSLSTGERLSSSKVRLGGVDYDITPIGETKYSKLGFSYFYKVFANGGGSTYQKWKASITASHKSPVKPAIFTSHWDNTTKHAYIMMPVMMGGEQFPTSLGLMVESMLNKNDNSGQIRKNLSYSNRYIMMFNFKSNAKSKSTNTTGVTEVATGQNMGTVLDNTKPILITGYNGGEEFSLADYFQTQDYLTAKRDKPPVTTKTVSGNVIGVDYLNLLKDFFTVKTDLMFTGNENSKIKYIDAYDFDGYKAQYEAHKGESAVQQISPDYSSFFESSAGDD